jgi:hypothetical protein
LMVIRSNIIIALHNSIPTTDILTNMLVNTSVTKAGIFIALELVNCIIHKITIDPCCGSGGMFVQSMKFVDRHSGNRQNISIIGQESQAETWRLCKMNLAIRGIAHNLGPTNASTFTNDLHKDKKVQFIMANAAVIYSLNAEKARNIKEFAA